MQLTSTQREQLQDALIKAFPSHNELAQMMYIQFGINIETIAEGNLTERAVDVIRWADKDDRLDELVTKARRANQTNKELIAFEKELQEAQPKPGERGRRERAATSPELNLLPAIGERLSKEALAETRVFLYKGHNILGRFFTLGPATLFVACSLAALILLIVPAYLMGIGFMEHFSAERGGLLKVGFLNLRSWNWWLMYPLVLPLLFAGTIWLSNYMRAVVAAFVDERVQLIVTKDGNPATTLLQDFSTRLAAQARILLTFSLVVALAILVADMWDILKGYGHYLNGRHYAFKEYDWSVAFVGEQFVQQPRWASPLPYLSFDIIAYGLQGLYIFLGIFWTYKFWLYLKTFSNFINPRHQTYRFKPMVYDPKERLGLYPMGRLFNGFILIMIAFQCYILGHRLQQIHGLTPLHEYLYESFKVVNPANLLNLEFLKSSFHYRSLDVGMMLLLFFGTLPIIIVSYFPVWTLHRYVSQQQHKAYLEYGRDYEEAKEAGDAKRAEALKEKMSLLEHACIWPNGDVTAKRFLTIMGTLAVAAIFPPLFIYGAAAFILLEVRRYLL